MDFSCIFSNSTFSTCLVIISLLFVGIISIYFSQKITNLNHKFESTVDTINSLTEEIHILKNIVIISRHMESDSNGNGNGIDGFININSNEPENIIQIGGDVVSKKITVSDDEESEVKDEYFDGNSVNL